MNLQKHIWIRVIFYFALLFLFLEIFLRLYKIESLSYFRKIKKIHQYHPSYLIGLRPDTREWIQHYTKKWEGWFTINSIGMRELKEPDPETQKVICLGDSLVMGFGVSDRQTFCYLLDQKFENYQFLNAGIDGLGSWGYLQRLKEILQKVSNIHTVLLFVSPNDYAMPEVLRQRGFLPDDIIEKQRLEKPLKKWIDSAQFLITDWFYSIYILKLMLKQLQLKWAIWKQEWKSHIQQWKDTPLTIYIKNSFLLPVKKIRNCPDFNERKKIFFTIGKKWQEGSSQDSFVDTPGQCPEPIPEEFRNECTKQPNVIPDLPAFTKDVYVKMIQLSRQKKFRLIVVIIPMQIEEIYCYQHGLYHPLGLYALQAKKFFQEHNVGVIDLMDSTDLLCKVDRFGIRSHYIPEDGHLTESGNRWVAEQLSRILKEKYELGK